MGLRTSAISNLIARSTVYLDVRNYVTPPATLNQSNFQDALEAALADAVLRSNTAVLPFPGAQINAIPRYQVLVPEGAWWLTRSIVIPSVAATTTQPLCPGITGVDERSTIFFVDSNNFTATNNAVITAGGDSGDDYVIGLTLEKFAIFSHGGITTNLNAISVTLSIYLQLDNLSIFGFADNNGNPNYGWAIKLLDTGTASNNQYPKIRNVFIQGCSGGVYATNCLYLGMRDVHNRQNWIWDCMFSGCVVSMQGGSVESAGAPSGSPYYCSKGVPKVVTGWDVEIANGTGASVSVAAGDVTTVTGLSGMSATSDLYRWLYLEKSTGAYNGTDKVSGYYLITKVISATSVEIRKGSSHSSTGSLIWKTCQATQVDLEVFGMTYHEGNLFAAFGFYAATSGAGSCKIGNCNMANCDYAIEALGSESQGTVPIRLEGVTQSAKFVKARVCPSLICLEATNATIGDIDEFTREGLIMRHNSYTYGGITSYTPLGIPGPIHTAFLPTGDARTMCRFGGAITMFDTRVSSSLVRSGSNVTSWLDLIGNLTASLTNAAKYPQYTASNPIFNNLPSITFTGGSSANTCALNVTIPSSIWTRGQPTIVLVAATPSASLLPGGTYCRLRLVIDGVADTSILMLEDVNGTPGYWGSLYPPGEFQILAQAPDTNAHVFVMGAGGRSRPRISSEAGTRLMHNFNAARDEGWTPANMSLRFQDPTIGSSATFTATFAAVFPFGLSYHAREQLIDQLAREFGIARSEYRS